jgi:2-phosphoglycerate kinase
MTTFPSRNWRVLLIGGASGVGKTSVSYRLAQHFGVGITEVDDFQVILENMTTPEQQPILHYWNTLPEGIQLTPEEIVTHTLKVCRVMAPAIELVIANHLESRAPIVLEGGFLLPELAAQAVFRGKPNEGRVRGLFIDESDEEQIAQNFLQREPYKEPQTYRARVSALYSQWLRQEAERLSVPVITARPWDTVFERILATLGEQS